MNVRYATNDLSPRVGCCGTRPPTLRTDPAVIRPVLTRWSICARSVESASPARQHWRSTTAATRARNHSNARSATNASPGSDTSPATPESTAGKNHISARSAERCLVGQNTFDFTWKHTAAKRHSSVPSARTGSRLQAAWQHTAEFTPGKSRTNVRFVNAPLVSTEHCRTTWQFTRERSCLRAPSAARHLVAWEASWGTVNFTLAEWLYFVSGVARTQCEGARNWESNFYQIGNHVESNVRVCAALKWPEKLNSWKWKGARAPVPHSWRRQCSLFNVNVSN